MDHSLSDFPATKSQIMSHILKMNLRREKTWTEKYFNLIDFNSVDFRLLSPEFDQKD